MKNIFYGLLSLLLFHSLVVAQVITPEDVVMKGRTTLAPASLRQPVWIPSSSLWAWVDKDELFLIALNSDSAYAVLHLNDLNRAHFEQGLDSLKSFPLLNWTDGKQCWYQHAGNILAVELGTKSVSLKNSFDVKGEHTDIEPAYFSVAFTRANNLFVSSRGNELKVTSDTNPGIVNGQSVHRNEFGISKGTFWSPKGNLLAFYRMDESMVSTYPIMDLNNKPASASMIRYPMAGDSSHQVKIGVFSVLKQKTIWLATEGPADQYLTNVTWTPDEKYLFVAVLNRDQNHMKLQKFDANTGSLVVTVLEEKHNAYVEPQHGPLVLDASGNVFIWQSEKTGHNHLYLHDNGKEVRALTSGDWDVMEVIGLSDDKETLYLTGTAEDGLSRHLFKVSIREELFTQVTETPGTHLCKVNLNTGDFLDIYTALTVPRIISVCNPQGKTQKVLLKAGNPIEKYDACEVRLLKFYTEDSVALNARLILPSGFDSTLTYPVLVYVYGGPHAQMVTNSWLGGADLWLYSMAQRGFVVFTLDNRGSGNRGKQFEQYTFRNLGRAEAYDQGIGLDYLRQQKWTRPEEFYLFGWSFGGFMTIHMMTEYPEVFKKGVAGGPVCDWRMYEVMYTERYMDTPESNPEGYAASNLISRIGKLKGDLLVIHGTSDDVVLWQHSLALQQSAVKQGVILDYMAYPLHAHNVMGRDRAHLYKTVGRYLGVK
jgi:dipeptidyl-peptidase-4